jgi:hypothetical protein
MMIVCIITEMHNFVWKVIKGCCLVCFLQQVEIGRWRPEYIMAQVRSNQISE